MNIQIVEIRLHHEGKIKAFVDIKLGEITIRDFRVMQDNGKPYVKVPFVTYKDRKGQIRFRPIIDLPAMVRGQIDNVILSEYYGRIAEAEYGQGSKR